MEEAQGSVSRSRWKSRVFVGSLLWLRHVKEEGGLEASMPDEGV